MTDVYYRYSPLLLNLRIPFAGVDGKTALFEVKKYIELQNRGAAAQPKEDDITTVANRDFNWVRQRTLTMAYLTQALWQLHGGLPPEFAIFTPVGSGCRVSFTFPKSDD